ncbi:MAG: murein L,D-transpeptidase family protein [Pseudomonadota bacterium]
MRKTASKLTTVIFAGTLLAACNGVLESGIPKHERPIPDPLVKSIKAKGMTAASPILLRIFKQENVLEVWKKDNTGKYALLTDYEICKWSGKLGPKHKEGDRQAPEGFYHVSPGLMNPNSSYHLSFNMGFPNKYDRANDRTGSYLMIHGACSSAGCYSMTDEYAEELYSLAREAFKGGQKAFQIQAYPFRMTAENMVKHAGHKYFDFWKMLKEGSDHFEVTRKQPKVNVCEKRYVFNRYTDEGTGFSSREECPSAKTPRSLALAFNEKQEKDQEVFDRILKRDLTNPFLPEEKKPKVQTASIKADPTIGTVAVWEPQPTSIVTTPVPSKPDQPSTAPTETVLVEAKPEGESINPISAEISQQSQAETVAEAISEQPAVLRQTVTQIAIPQSAARE